MMFKIIKLAPIFIKSKIKKIYFKKEGFTLLEVILVIIIIELLMFSSMTFISSFINFYSDQDSNIFSTTEEKIGVLILSNDLFSAKNMVVKDNEILFDSYYKGKEKSLIYRVYDSSYGTALGKITKENIEAVINNVKTINFTKEEDLLLVDLEFIDPNQNIRHVKRVYYLRIK